jgi:hypothetical protein
MQNDNNENDSTNSIQNNQNHKEKGETTETTVAAETAVTAETARANKEKEGDGRMTKEQLLAWIMECEDVDIKQMDCDNLATFSMALLVQLQSFLQGKEIPHELNVAINDLDCYLDFFQEWNKLKTK